MERECNNTGCTKESCEGCEHRGGGIQKEPLNAFSSVRKVIGVVSGKGGVGKSLVTSMMACSMAKRGCRTAILDADVTGPSIPQIFGIHEKAQATELGITPALSKEEIKIMSVNLLLENETDPVVWRGPLIAGIVKQFWNEVNWGSVDYMFVDMPPGTGDVPLTVFQSLPVDGIIVVTSPQELVSMIVGKAVNMAKSMNVPILGIVENMSYFQCPDCGQKHYIFGNSHIEEVAEEYDIRHTARIPIKPEIAALCDRGEIETLQAEWLDGMADMLLK